MAWKGTERRKNTRGDFPIKVFIYSPAGGIISTYTKDISEKSVGVRLEEKLEKGVIVKLELYFEDSTISREGKVLWVKENIKEGKITFDMGIEFIEADSE